jgi:hypothetical protein
MHQIGGGAPAAGVGLNFPLILLEMNARRAIYVLEQYGFDVLHSMVLNKYMIYIGT